MITFKLRNTRKHAAFHKHCKDMLQDRLMILMSFCPKFIGVYNANNYFTVRRFDKVIAKIIWCSFFAPQCRHQYMAWRNLFKFYQNRASFIEDITLQKIFVSFFWTQCINEENWT